MKTLRRLVDLVRDSPTFGRDRANLVSGFTIGTTALLLNGAVLFLVLPLMLNPDDRDFRVITENIEFGQLLALILLGGATAFSTLLIPLRLLSVFWGPRIGRYFDQVVLSGISPLRFVIGKAMSQNLFLGLIFFLLLPYLVLSLTLGGVNPSLFFAGLFLVWLYCMQLALVTLWASLYLNELLAAFLVMSSATILSVLGCIPMPFQPFVLTPFPALMYPVYTSIPFFDGRIPTEFFLIFLSCTACMTTVSGAALFAIYLGPLYGIIRENSTFGEVVRSGDSKRKRWFRLRLHIQRPSEIAFFYENRSDTFRGSEGAIRWGIGFVGLVLLSSAVSLAVVYSMSALLLSRGGSPGSWWVYEFHTFYLVLHGCGLVLGILVFSHAMNSTYLRIPFIRGRTAVVSGLDTAVFLLFALVSTALSIGTPFYFEQMFASPLQVTLFPGLMYVTRGRTVDFVRVAVEGSIVISIAGLVVYALHRFFCLMTWLRSATFVGVAGAYCVGVCMMPLVVAMLFLEVFELRDLPLVAEWAPVLAMASPVTVIMSLFNEMGSRFPRDASTAPFYVVHGILLVIALFGIHRRGRRLRVLYLPDSTTRTLLAGLMLFVGASPAIAQTDETRDDSDTPGLVIEATAGWDGTVDQSAPVPISFLISNYSKRPIEGQFVLSDPMNGHVVLLGEVYIAPEGTRRFTSIQSLTNWFECFATLEFGGHVLWRRELALHTGNTFLANVNYALLIDDSGRTLPLPGATNTAGLQVSTELTVAGEAGRQIECLTVKSWQVPNHPGAIIVAQAVLFPERSGAIKSLNRIQWQALAEWMCLGGTIFVHNESADIVDRLNELAPLEAGERMPSGEDSVRRVGLGAIHEYSLPLFSSGGETMRQQIATAVANLPKHHITTITGSAGINNHQVGRADINRGLVVAFFVLYTFISGAVTLVLFRLTRRRIALYTVTVVLGASVLSGVLGGILRVSEGDLRWMTVTQSGAGGLVQIGRIDVQSAGGRNKTVAISGERTDLQSVGTPPRYYSWNQRPMGYPPFSWQPNLAKSDTGIYKVNVPMTPWGIRRLYATAYDKTSQGMDFNLKFEPHILPRSEDGAESDSTDMPAGDFSLTLVNRFPFDVSDCWLVIGATRWASGQTISQQGNRSGLLSYFPRPPQAVVPTKDGLIDVYHMKQLHSLPSDEIRTESFEAEFEFKNADWDMSRTFQGGSVTPPRISRLGTASAWIIGRIQNPPGLSIDRAGTDFVPQESLHLFIQEIRPENMPDASLFLNSQVHAQQQQQQQQQ
jgi:hypothetical protein